MNIEADEADPASVETRGDVRLKIVLLCVALLLAAAYATVLGLGATLFPDIGGLWAAAIILTCPAVAAGAALLFWIRRRARRGRVPKVVDTTRVLARLGDRSALLDALATEIAGRGRSERPFALHVVDIDAFAAFNESMGEAAGTAFLDRVATTLFEAGRSLFRIGDDEFAIVQTQLDTTRAPEIFAETLATRVAGACDAERGRRHLGASHGVAVWPQHGEAPRELLHAAALALAAAKRAGGARTELYTPRLGSRLDALREMERAIGTGLPAGWFELRFQPQYDLTTRRLAGFEARPVMHHPERGELPAELFMPAAEMCGLAPDVGRWAFPLAFATAALWPSNLMLEIGATLAEIRGRLPPLLGTLLEEHGVEARRVRLAVAASATTADATLAPLYQLAEQGVAIAITEFGGSNLEALARSPATAVKLDRPLIRCIDRDRGTERLLAGLMGAAQSLEMSLHAAGVERPRQLQFLLARGCGNLQGSLFGDPVPIGGIAAVIARDLRKELAEANATAGPSAQAPSMAASRMSR